MKYCLHCSEPMPLGRKSNAKYCSDACRVKSWRQNHDIPEPFHNVTPKMTKSYTCCSNGLFYSPITMNGKILICDTCGAIWERKIDYTKPQERTKCNR